MFVRLESPDRTTVFRLGEEHRVDASNGLYAELREEFGADCIS